MGFRWFDMQNWNIIVSMFSSKVCCVFVTYMLGRSRFGIKLFADGDFTA